MVRAAGGYLLDVNMLIALLVRRHSAHVAAQRWFDRWSSGGWATCPLTETGFVRIVNNPAFEAQAGSLADVTALLSASLQHPSHIFWPADLSWEQAVSPLRDRVRGHRQISDAYRLGLAIHRGGKLVTLDRRIRHLLPPEGELQQFLHLVD